MSGDRRAVRVTSDFFRDLDRALPSERGPAGQPSAIDFQTLELLRIVEHFAVSFDDLPELFPDRADYRLFIAAGMLVPRFSVIGQLASDGAVELVQLEIDLDAPW
ncbi:hypothetical protein [Candidatus Poriferisocius sp.]|uniref:hypothetical protein n=1 Tax=Candidatus Poriferisocius sp. TaxID=3101276 RepID=UPI003B0123FE